MEDVDRPRNGDTGRYLTWRDWASERKSILSDIDSRIAEDQDGRRELMAGVTNRIDRHDDKIDELQRNLMAAPEGDRPGGLLWQMGELRKEQRQTRRNIVVALGALSFVFNLLSPWLGTIVSSVIGVPRP